MSFSSKLRKPLFATLATCAFFVLQSQAAHADYAVKNLDANEGGGSSYSRNVALASSGSELFVRAFIAPTWTSTRTHRITVSGLPSGLVPLSISTSDSDCASITNVNVLSTGFSFDFPGDCDGVAVAKYRTSGVSAGTYSFSAVVDDCSTDGICGNSDDVLTSTNGVSLTVSSLSVLTRATTLDTDGDGYLDAFDLFWNVAPMSPLSVSDVTVRVDSRLATGLSYPSSLTSSGRLSFTDSQFSWWELPRIEVRWSAAFQTGSYYVGVVEDGAAPIITPSVASGTYTWAVSVSLSSSESGSLRYAFGSWSANVSSTAYSSPISINSPTVLSAYATDLAGNSRRTDFAYAFVCAISAPTNGYVTAYPGCSVWCNSGYSLVGWACVANSSSSSGGGSSSGGSSGGSSSGWSSGGSSGGSSSGGSSGWSSGGSSGGLWTPGTSYALPATLTKNTAELTYFSTLSGAVAYLDTVVKDSALKSQYLATASKISIPDSAYYLSLDRNVRTDYNRVINAYVLNFVRLSKSKSFTLTENEKADLSWASETLESSYAWVSKPESRYVDAVDYGTTGLKVFRTKLGVIKLPLVKFEKKYVGKFDALLRTNTIDRATYAKAVDGWNRFVLHLTMYRQFWATQASKDRALAAIVQFEPIYKKRVRTYLSDTVVTQVPVSVSPSVEAPALAFPRDLTYWEASEDVRKLQQAMKDAGYFGTLSPTGYFWPSTKAALVKFSAEVLKVSNPDWAFAWAVRSAANARFSK